MRILRKLVLLAILAIAASAIVASSALAQGTEPLAHNQTPRLIVQQEVHAANDVNCPAVTPGPPAPVPGPLVTAGGCRVHVLASNAVITEHDAVGNEFTMAVCNIEADMRVDAAGEGYWTHHELTGPNCNIKACGQVTPPTSEGRAWSFFMHESEVAGSTVRERATVLFCIEPIASQTPEHCEWVMPITQPTTHRYRLSAVNVPAHGTFLPRCELDAVFNTEAGGPLSGENEVRQNIEIRHN